MKKTSSKSVMITGSSCTGKSTIINQLVDKTHLTRVPGFTTRIPRKSETNGFDFLYLKSKQDLKKIFKEGGLIDPDMSVIKYNNNFYGSPKKWINMPQSGSSILFSPTSSITAARIKAILDEIVIWVHLFADEKTRKNRLLARAVPNKNIQCRLSQGDCFDIMCSADLNLNTGELGVNDIVQIILATIDKGD